MKLIGFFVLLITCASSALASSNENCDAVSLKADVDRNKETLLVLVEQQASLVAQLEKNHLLLEKLMLEMNTKTNIYDKETLRTILEDIRYSTDKMSQRQ